MNRTGWMTSLGGMLVLALVLGDPATGAAQDHGAHHGADHRGHEDKLAREIKARADEEVQALLEGDGAGYALAAELNGFPGPMHVLDLAGALSLTERGYAVRAGH